MEKKTLSLSDLQAEANVSAEENNNAVETPAEDTPVTPQPVEEEKPTSIRDNPLYNLGNPTEDAIKEVAIEDVAKYENENFAEKEYEKKMNDFDEQTRRAFQRRFGPAIEEVQRMADEYEERKEIEGGDVRVVSTYDKNAEVNPDEALTKEEIEERNAIALAEARKKSPAKKVETKTVETPATVKEETVDDIEAELLDQPTVPEQTVVDPEDDDKELDIIDDDIINDLGLADEMREIEEKEREERLNKRMATFKDQLRTMLVPNKAKTDLSKFKILKSTMPASNILSKQAEETPYYTWVLPYTGISVSVSPLSAIEIQNLINTEEGRNNVEAARAQFELIWKHLHPKCNAGSFENWCKKIHYADIDHLYFAVYKACFQNANIIGFQCQNTKCDNIFAEKREIMEMVKFGSDKDKELFDKLYQKDPSVDCTLEEDLMEVSDKYAIGVGPITLYNILFEINFVDKAMTEKYDTFVGMAATIKSLYRIDEEKEALIPIAFRTDKNDVVKTYKYRIASLYKIFNTLSDIDLNDISDRIGEYADKYADSIDISYQMPAATCPECGDEIQAAEAPAQQLVFIRHRLVQVLNS
jgi:hypothetical protein